MPRWGEQALGWKGMWQPSQAPPPPCPALQSHAGAALGTPVSPGDEQDSRRGAGVSWGSRSRELMGRVWDFLVTLGPWGVGLRQGGRGDSWGEGVQGLWKAPS